MLAVTHRLQLMEALVLVDVQRNMLEGDGAVPAAKEIRKRLERLLNRARDAGAPLIHVQNDGGDGDPDLPWTEGWELVFAPAPGEIVVRKSEPDTFASNATLAADLRSRGIDHLLIAGMQSEYCVAATARGGKAAGFAVTVLRGAHATFDQQRLADEIAAATEHELARDGVEITDWAEAQF
jgi:nicotinamidase-related amidase